jgi:hypothetical protein
LVLVGKDYELVEQKTGALGTVLRHHGIESVPPFGGFLGVGVVLDWRQTRGK